MGRSDSGVNAYTDITGVYNGSDDAVSLSVQGHFVSGDNVGRLDSELSALDKLGALVGEQERERAPQANVTLPVTVEDTACVVVTDGLETIEKVTAGRQRPLTPGDAFNLYKGRKMLRTFNAGR